MLSPPPPGHLGVGADVVPVKVDEADEGAVVELHVVQLGDVRPVLRGGRHLLIGPQTGLHRGQDLGYLRLTAAVDRLHHWLPHTGGEDGLHHELGLLLLLLHRHLEVVQLDVVVDVGAQPLRGDRVEDTVVRPDPVAGQLKCPVHGEEDGVVEDPGLVIFPGVLRLEVDHVNNLCDPEAAPPVGPDHFVLEEPRGEADPGPGGADVAAHPGAEAGVGQGGPADVALVVAEPLEDEVLVLRPATRGAAAQAPGQFVGVERDVATCWDEEEQERDQSARASEETEQQSEVANLVSQEACQGGVKMNNTGMTAFTIAVSSIVMPGTITTLEIAELTR